MSLFHERFRQLKEESGKTQVQIANDLGIKQQAVSYYVNGREPDYDTLIAIAEYFSVTLDYLLGVSDCRRPENEDFCKKTGLSEKAVEVLSGVEPSAYLLYGKEVGTVIDRIICSQNLINIVSSFLLLTNPEWLMDRAKRVSLFPDDESFYKSDYDFMIAAAERQLSENIIDVCTKIREEKENR